MEKIIQGENITLYVWANLKKNPRYPVGDNFPVDVACGHTILGRHMCIV